MNLFDRPLRYVGVDDIHWKCNKLLSLNKTWNFAISGRIPGKSTSINLMLYRQWYEKNRTFIYIKRLIADITCSGIDSIATNINKFLKDDEKIQFVYSKGDLKSGLCDVYCYPANIKINIFNCDEDHKIFKVIALSVPQDRYKSNIIRNCEWMWFDEFCVSKKLGGKYLPFEAEIFDNMYNTFYRESTNLRIIMAGNPYSKYNNYTALLKMNLTDIKVGNTYSGNNWAIEYIKISDELKQWVIDHNNLLELVSEEQAMFDLEGATIEDDNIQIEDVQPNMSELVFVFKVNGRLVGVYRIPVMNYERDCSYWCAMLPNDYFSVKRKVHCFNAYDLCANAHIVANSERNRFAPLVKAYRFWQICYKDLEAANYMEEVFEYLV